MSSLIDVLRQAGFSGSSLNTAYAIAMAESGGNAHAFNGNTGTGDQSYGLFQINMLGGMGPERRQQFGLSSNDDLYDAVKNAQVAYKMSKGGTDWSPWSTYKRGDYKKYMGHSGASVTGGGVDTKTATARPGGDILSAPSGDPFASNAGVPFASDAGDPFATPRGGDLFGSPKATPTRAATPGADSTSFRDKVISTAMQQLGVPYAWGGGGVDGASSGFAQGAGTVGFDCSSLMMYAFGRNGYSLPRVSQQQLSQGTRTSISSLRPGDLVGWGDGGHVALYLGGGRILEAPHTGANVRVRSLGNGGFDSSAFGIRLNLPGDSSG